MQERREQTRSTRPVYAVVIRDIEGAYQAQVVEGLSVAARARGCTLMLFCGRALNAASLYEQQFNMAYRIAEQADVDGAIVVGSTFSSQAAPGVLDRMIQEFAQRMPTVSVGYAGQTNATSIMSDNRSGTRALVQHLMQEHGCRRFAYIHGQARNPDELERWQALRETLAEAGLGVQRHHEAWGEFIRTGGRQAMQALMPQLADIDVVVAANDEMAMGALEVLLPADVPVPGRIRVAGFDDMFGSGLLRLPLTSVRQDPLRQAHTALDLLAAGAPPGVVRVPTELAVHTSCGCGHHLLLEAARTAGEPSAGFAGAEAELAGALLSNPTEDGDFLDRFSHFAGGSLRAGIGKEALLDVLLRLSERTTTDARVAARIPRRLVMATGMLTQIYAIHHDRGNLLQQIDAWTFGGLLQQSVIGQRSEDLRDALHAAFTRIGIRTAFVCVFANPGNLTPVGARRAVPANARLLFGMVDGAALPEEEAVFPSSRLLPPELPELHETSLVLQPLFNHRDHYGYCVLERDSRWLVLLEEVRDALSAVVCGRLIVGELERARDQLRKELDQSVRDRDTLSEQANRDELTGLLNRRGLMRVLLAENGTQSAHGLLMIDLDGLKSINDQHGHVAGDAAIRSFAGLLAQAVGAQGVCARLGGDEFVAALSCTEEAATLALIETLRSAVEGFNTQTTHPWRLAYSMGRAHLDGHGMEDVIDALRNADERLYEDKAEHKRAGERRREERRLH